MPPCQIGDMKTTRFIHCQDRAWLEFLYEFPDDQTLAELAAGLNERPADLHVNLVSE
jgi:hypothetical protein